MEISLTPEQSQLVLAQLVADRQVKVSTVEKALDSLRSNVREQLANIEGSVGTGRAKRSSGAKAKRRGPASKGRQLAGQYMSAIRSLPKGQQKAVKDLRAKKGVVQAIRFAKGLKSGKVKLHSKKGKSKPKATATAVTAQA